MSPVLCPLNGTAAGTCTLPMWTDEKQDANPLTFRRACAEIFLTDGTGTQGQAGYAPRRLTGHCTTAPAETQRQAGAQPRWLAHSLWL